MSKRKHSLSTFKEIWLTDPIFQLWIAKVPEDLSLAWCKLCKSNINISKMGRSALNDHARGKRHLDIIEERQKKYKCELFQTFILHQTNDFNHRNIEFRIKLLECRNIMVFEYGKSTLELQFVFSC